METVDVVTLFFHGVAGKGGERINVVEVVAPLVAEGGAGVGYVGGDWGEGEV